MPPRGIGAMPSNVAVFNAMTSIYERFLAAGQQRHKCPLCDRNFALETEQTHFEAQIRHTLERVPTMRDVSERAIVEHTDRREHALQLREPASELAHLRGPSPRVRTPGKRAGATGSFWQLMVLARCNGEGWGAPPVPGTIQQLEAEMANAAGEVVTAQAAANEVLSFSLPCALCLSVSRGAPHQQAITDHAPLLDLTGHMRHRRTPNELHPRHG